MLHRSSNFTPKAFLSHSNSLASTTALFQPLLASATRAYRNFGLPKPSHRKVHSHLSLNSHNANYLGGRTAVFRFHGATKAKHGAEWKRHEPTVRYNIDVWNSQQTVRRQWKGRNWRVVELPFEKAPAVMQKVIPEEYTEMPMMADPAKGDFSNIRRKTFAQEDLQEVLFGTGIKVLPSLVERGGSSVKLDSFFSCCGSEGAPR